MPTLDLGPWTPHTGAIVHLGLHLPFNLSSLMILMLFICSWGWYAEPPQPSICGHYLPPPLLFLPLISPRFPCFIRGLTKLSIIDLLGLGNSLMWGMICPDFRIFNSIPDLSPWDAVAPLFQSQKCLQPLPTVPVGQKSLLIASHTKGAYQTLYTESYVYASVRMNPSPLYVLPEHENSKNFIHT